jgi:CDP-diacylglycerol--serine O-phosphatidyltransferase
MSYLWAVDDLGLSGANVQFITPVIAIATGLLMVSRFRYFSFKSWPRSDRVPFYWILVVVLILVALAMNPARMLFAIAALYALSGPVLTVWGLRQRRARHGQPPAAEEHPQP